MKVKELIELLAKINPEADVVVHRDPQNYGFGKIDRIEVGVFESTDYGNDFYPEQRTIVSASQIKALCIYPDDIELPIFQDALRH